MEKPQIHKSILDKIDKNRIDLRLFKIFISYSDKDKNLAGEIKNELEQFKISVFLAHDGMIPTGSRWDDQIKKNIKNCDIFLTLFTKNFIESEWTCQEIGIAIGMNKSIISLKIDVDPTGFLKGEQALKLKNDDIHESCLEIIKSIFIKIKNDSIRNILKNCIIFSLRHVSNFNDSEDRLTILKDCEFNDNQINDIFGSAILNHQIRMSHLGESQLREWKSTYLGRLDPDIKETFEKVEKYWTYDIHD